MSKSTAQDVHANNPQDAIDAYLHKYDIHDSFGTVDPEAIFGGSQMYFGSGNSPANYHIDQNNTLGFQLDLKEHYRTGDDIAPTSVQNGVANFEVPAGTQVVDPAHDVSSANPNRAAWNFDYVVATGLNGANTSLTDFTFKLQVTQNGTNTHVFTLDPATHVWIDDANPAVGFGGDDFAHAASTSVQSHVAENSVNLAFIAGAFGDLTHSTAANTTYDIQLEAFKGVQLAGLVHDHLLLV